MSPTLTTFLFEAANFLVLAAVLGWLFFQPVREALHHRRHQLAGVAEQAEQKLAEAKRAEQKIETTRANLRQELQELRTRELDAARAQANQLLAEAHASARRELELAHSQAQRLSDTQLESLARVAASTAAQAVERLLSQLGGTDLHDALLQSAWQQLRQLREHGAPGGDHPAALDPEDASGASSSVDVAASRLAPVKVESARPLTAAQQAALEQALGPDATRVTVHVVSSLRTGVRISTGRGLIDASAAGLASFARHALVREMNHRVRHDLPQSPAHDV